MRIKYVSFTQIFKSAFLLQSFKNKVLKRYLNFLLRFKIFFASLSIHFVVFSIQLTRHQNYLGSLNKLDFMRVYFILKKVFSNCLVKLNIIPFFIFDLCEIWNWLLFCQSWSLLAVFLIIFYICRKIMFCCWLSFFSIYVFFLWRLKLYFVRNNDDHQNFLLVISKIGQHKNLFLFLI